MDPFLIQTYNGRICHDFSFHLIESLNYHNWYRGEDIYDMKLSDVIILDNGYIPIGSLEFVFDYLNKHYGLVEENFSPINIPKELMKEKYLKRNVSILNKNEIILEKDMFVKSNDFYKSFTDIISDVSLINVEGNFLVSEVVDIKSEWRCFIQHGKLVGLKNYSGDFTLFPDVGCINDMIDTYISAPLSYTLDVGINENGTFIIEVHPFVSCGLYGFNDYKRLPLMFIEGLNYFLRGKR